MHLFKLPFYHWLIVILALLKRHITNLEKTLKWKFAQKLERLWWKRYLHKQTPEVYKAWKNAYWEKLFNYFAIDIDLKPNALIADIGCGPAGIFSIFQNYEVVAVDPLLDSYAHDLAVFNKEDYPNTQFVNAGIEEFNWPQTFDLLCCLDAINHVSNLTLAFEKLFALTKPGGFCLLSTDAHNHNFLKHLFKTIPGDALHPHQYNLAEYQDMFKSAGFELLKTELYKTHPIFNYYLLLGKKPLL